LPRSYSLAKAFFVHPSPRRPQKGSPLFPENDQEEDNHWEEE